MIFLSLIKKRKTMPHTFDIGKVETKDETIRNPHAEFLPEHPARCFFSGSSGSGKTNLILKLLLDSQFGLKNFFQIIFVFCPTALNDPSFEKLKEIVPDENIFLDPQEDKINEIVGKQTEIVRKLGKKMSPSILMLFDDCITNKILDTPGFKILFFRGRHLNMSTWVSLQYFNNLPKSVRQNITNFFLFKPFRAEIKVICEELCPATLEMKTFQKLIDSATDPREGDSHPFLHVDKTKPFSKMFRRNLTKIIKVAGHEPGTLKSSHK